MKLEPVTVQVAREILAGELGGVKAGPGWPHADTLDALSMAATSAGEAWFIEFEELVVGDIGTHGAPDRNGDVEIGYGVALPFRRRGIAVEAIAAIIAMLCERPGVRRVVAHTDAGNLASRRALTGAGFCCQTVDAATLRYVFRRA